MNRLLCLSRRQSFLGVEEDETVIVAVISRAQGLSGISGKVGSPFLVAFRFDGTVEIHIAYVCMF